MLDLRPSCEHCQRLLPADAPGAAICSYECTFCQRCAEDLLAWVCPNCGGALSPRPPRPTEQLAEHPGSVKSVHKSADLEAHPVRIEHRLAAAGRPTHLWELVVDCRDPEGLAGFYGTLLDVPAVVRDSEWAYVDPHSRGPMLVQGGRPLRGVRLAFQKVPEPRAGKVRIHLDVGAWNFDQQIADAIALGASQVSELRQDSTGAFVVMTDPEDHEFCFVSP